MAKDWILPDISLIQNTGPEWLFGALEPLSDTSRMVALMIFWRSWHVRNEIIHDKEPPPTEVSCRFLHSYISSLLCIQQHPMGDVVKGKMVLTDPACLAGVVAAPAPSTRGADPRPTEKWEPPPAGWLNLNVDGAFSEHAGNGGAGMVLRNSDGNIIFTSCRHLFACDNALRAELEACKEGISLALEWSSLPFIIETDSSVAARMISQAAVDRSKDAALVQEIKMLTRGDRRVQVKAIKRERNQVSHELARIARTDTKTAVWLGSGLEGIVNLCVLDQLDSG
ncbi:hypothetical protein VPH35_094151 [Triticum aestivum]